MLHRLNISVFVLASVLVQQCHSFKRVRRRYNLPISAKHHLHLPSHCHPHRRNSCKRNFLSSTPQLLLSIRGGKTSDGHDEDDYDEDEFTQSFIASFESELAEIRRNAEEEAENEIQKLRELIERRDGDVKEEEDAEAGNEDDDVNPESAKNVELKVDAEENETEESEPAEEEEVIQEEEVDTSPDEGGTEANDQTIIGSDEVLSEDGNTVDIDQSDTESDIEDDAEEESVSIEDTEDLQDGESKSSGEELAGDETEEEVDDQTQIESDAGNDIDEESASAEDDDVLELDESDATINDEAADVTSVDESACESSEASDNDVNELVIKPKKSKKKKRKKKSSKMGKRKKKAKIHYSEEESDFSDLSDEIETDYVGDSISLTRTEDEVMEQPPQSGVWFYLRSDLGRALVLFIATIALAILTQRVQRQMEEEGAI
eukprot:CAMPEP_0183722140 /NCGR_PEP_ID=MMETSP0737-20130205/14188_1 /TAXON_ID=385413 /ORGANISM="Thalassiosira miniscula, Strain CCMP1093" /LENGTH=432 /DNA_ID=CAMNT_0025952253 /DNA_START=247 /DNA_END=1545 /DNA_ORIENTATION=+